MERLDKLIANRTGRSRKEARGLIRAGGVLVDGVAVRSPEAKIGPDAVLTVGGERVGGGQFAYLMLNKPAGVLCATRDRDGRTVLDLVPDTLRRKGLFPAGRLDKDAEGLVLLTDDGALAHRILSPGHRHPKTYRVRLDRSLDWDAAGAAVMTGVAFGQGRVSSPGRLTLLEAGNRPLVELVIHEGAFHQVKRMMAALGAQVLHLERVRIGALELDPALPRGGCRPLRDGELERLERVE